MKTIGRWGGAIFFLLAVMLGGAETELPFWQHALFTGGGATIGFIFSLWLLKKTKEK